ncbi:hypothetical protein ACGFX8_36485 [Streptomyces sp. NPDC048362]|uniref:hypothetical protein n=1 Tax=Streptomyces sp. NPDC048362 TaxID=3365539 RepID=UPI00371503B2
MSDIPKNLPVRCIQCDDIHVITSQERDPETGLPRWRYTCLDCAIAWWVDQHGGTLGDYERRDPLL